MATPASRSMRSQHIPDPGRNVRGQGPARLLVVHTDDLEREIAAAALRGAGYRVLEAATGEEALTMLETQAQSIDAVFTDVEMPCSDDGHDGSLVSLIGERWPAVRLLCTSASLPAAGGKSASSRLFLVEGPLSATSLIRKVGAILEPGPDVQRVTASGARSWRGYSAWLWPWRRAALKGAAIR